MELHELRQLYERRQSCREFSEKPLEQETVKAICEAALLAPSAMNAQPWKLVILMGEKRDEALKSLQHLGMNKFLGKAQAIVLVAEGKSGGLMKVGAAFKENEFVQHDLGLLTAHLVLAAEASGVGSCIIGWRKEEALRTLAGLPEKAHIPVVVALGYPAEDYPVREKKRKPLGETLVFLDTPLPPFRKIKFCPRLHGEGFSYMGPRRTLIWRRAPRQDRHSGRWNAPLSPPGRRPPLC